MTDRHTTNQPTNQRTDMRGQREVTLSIRAKWGQPALSFIDILSVAPPWIICSLSSETKKGSERVVDAFGEYFRKMNNAPSEYLSLVNCFVMLRDM